MSVYGFTVTTAGEALLAQAAGSGQALVITGTQVGSGAVENAAAAKALTALLSPQQAGTYSTPQINGGQISLIVEYRNNLNGGLTSGFSLNEFGIFARVGAGQATLLAYGSLGDSPAAVHPIADGLETYRYPVAMAFSGDLEVTVEDPSGAFVTDDALSDYIPLTQKGQPGGVASLDDDGKIPAVQIPDLYLPLTGGTMTGHITLPGVPSGDLQAIPKKYADELFMIAMGQGIVRVQVYETGTQTPIGGVAITGATDYYGNTLYADDSGLAIGLATSDKSTLQVDTRYIDLTGQTQVTIPTPKQQVTEVTLYATRVTNDSAKIETFSSSTQKMFTDKVGQVDVHCIGAGQGGGRGSAGQEDGHTKAVGGSGGSSGSNSYKNNVDWEANTLFDITVGLGGQPAWSDDVSTASGTIYADSGDPGGSSSCLGVSASGGTGSSITSGAISYNRTADGVTRSPAGTAQSVSGHLFGDESLGNCPGGSGGGGSAWAGHFPSDDTTQPSSEGGSPNGGDGGGPAAYNSAPSGKNGSTGGGGGGGATSNYSGQSTHRKTAASGGLGGDGVVYIRWRYAA